jgi:putative alpha-1,2-mannosidase
MSKLEVDAIEPQSGTTLTLGGSGDTIVVGSGATFAGAGMSWQSVQTTGFTASAGNAYPCNTTSAGFTVTLPATPSAGDQVQVSRLCRYF